MNGAGPPPDPIVRRPGDAQATAVPDRPRLGRRRRGRPARPQRVGGRTGTATRPSWRSCPAITRDRAGTRRVVARLDLEARSATTLYEPAWQIEGLALSPGRALARSVVEGYASDHGLLSGSVDGHRPDDRNDHRPVAGPGDGRLAPLVRRRLALVRADRRHRQRVRPDVAGRPARGALARRRVHRRRGDHAGVRRSPRTPPTCGPRIRRTAGRPSSRGSITRAAVGRGCTSFNDHIVAGRVFPDVRTIRWTADDGMEIEGLLMTPHGADGAAADDRLRARRPDVELGRVLLRLRAERGAAGVGRLRVPAAEPAREHRPRTRVRAGRDRRRGRHRLPRHHGRRRPLHRRGRRRPGPARHRRACRTAATWRGGPWGRRTGSAPSVAMSVVSNYVSFHLTSEVWWYDQAILEGEWHDPASQYAERSPVTHAHRCTTPTLIIQGAEDRCTPLGQAEELFHAIAESGRRGRARRVSARGPRSARTRPRARRDPADAGVVRPTPRSLGVGVRRVLQRLDVDLLHLQHRLHGALGAPRVGVAQQLAEPLGDDLPAQAEPVLEPAALTFLAAPSVSATTAGRPRPGPCSWTWSEMASVNGNSGPPLMAMNSWPASRKVTDITWPRGRGALGVALRRS